ncbi:glycine-rich domain-containing protein [Streptomyces johnsoniae]|uniref:Uncharacterized protein n=1 Tax=Streptomyces johnsoniae TaxID=3075532 RepID=A0ABU2S4F6_9ACTN|nr:hypothetical protein [Streptomyces sp. DSM 41886]MDT0443856.1 hypothetical protein [Streptomyces sp. DSM 41886]
MSSIPTVAPRTGRELLTDEEFAAVTATVLDNNPGMRMVTAERIAEQALAFVATAAGTELPLAPSRVVDEGWHALILHTRLYEALGNRLGQFVHHVPERPDSTRAAYDPDWLPRTTDAIRQAGYEVDEDLWRGPEDVTVPVRAPAQHTPKGPNCTVIQPKPKPKPTTASAGTV